MYSRPQIIYDPKSTWVVPSTQPAESPCPEKSNPFAEGLSDHGMATENEWGNTIRIGRLIHIRDDASDRSLFNLPVQATGADGFKLALIRISEKLNRLNARIVHTQHDEIIVEAKDDIADRVQTIVKESMVEAFEKIIPEVQFVAEIRVANSWKP